DTGHRSDSRIARRCCRVPATVPSFAGKTTHATTSSRSTQRTELTAADAHPQPVSRFDAAKARLPHLSIHGPFAESDAHHELRPYPAHDRLTEQATERLARSDQRLQQCVYEPFRAQPV